MNKYDVVVVGGGPAGGYVAKTIAREGFKVAVFEEHKAVGQPLKCAGLVTSRVFDFFKLPKEEIVQNEIYGARIHSPSGTVMSIGGDKARALAIDRLRFDAEIINQARCEGAEIFLENKIVSAQKNIGGVILKSKQNNSIKQIACDLLIGADGPHSKIREAFQFPQPLELLRGMGAEITNLTLDPRFVEIFLGNVVAPCFFAWIIHINKSVTKERAGLCISKNSKYQVKHYFSNLFTNPISASFLHNAKITKYIAGSIPLGALKKTADSNVMLVGDAAAQVKPTSGGGIYMGMLCARYCSSVATEALNKKKFSAQILKKYHRAWTGDVGRELLLGMKFRTIFKNLNDKQINKYIEKFNNDKVIELINKYGDIDYPSKLMLPLVKKAPSLLRLLLHYKKTKSYLEEGGGGT